MKQQAIMLSSIGVAIILGLTVAAVGLGEVGGKKKVEKPAQTKVAARPSVKATPISSPVVIKKTTPKTTPKATPKIVPTAKPTPTPTPTPKTYPAFCTAPPQETEIGSLKYAVKPEYSHLDRLGEVLTFLECSSQQQEQLDNINKGVYTQDSSIILHKLPSEKLQAVLKSLGYGCAGNAVTEDQCTEWYGNTIGKKIKNFEVLIPYVEDVKYDDCVMTCG